MSDFVYRLDLSAVLLNPAKTEEERFKALANLISDRLDILAVKITDRGLPFEASATQDLAIRFYDFAEGEDTSCYQFSRLWDELSDWGETFVQVGAREKSLCNLPNLPISFSC